MESKIKSPNFALILFLSLSLTLCLTFAASGGRMGGDSFSEQQPPPPPTFDYHHYERSHHHHHHRHQQPPPPPPTSDYHHHERSHHHRHPNRGYDEKEQSREWSKKDVIFAFIIPTGMIGAFALIVFIGYLNNRGSVIMVQVGLTGSARSLQKELNEIAETANSSSAKGWQLILTETVTALLRHPQYYIFGYTSVKQHSNAESIEKGFRELSSEERGKIDTESLVNVNNVRRRRAVTPMASKDGKDYIVVTILVAAKGSYEIPLIKSIDDMKDALRSLSIGSSNLKAVEVLWTPQDENDTLSDEELLESYPLLRPI